MLNHVVIACDSFKECMSAKEACEQIEKGFKQVFPNAKYITLALGDGGEGTGQLLSKYLQVAPLSITVHNQAMIKIKTELYMNNHLALIESAACIGLDLIGKEQRTPTKFSSYGVGEMINAAVSKGVKKIIVTLGGSGTNDGGIGMLLALGTKFYNKDKQLFQPTIMEVDSIDHICIDEVQQALEGIELIIASDVSNVFCGPLGATKVFAKQKGAIIADIDILETKMICLNECIKKSLSIDLATLAGSGAAGGLGGALVILGFQMKSGIDIMLSFCNFVEHAANTDLIISGEGSLDSQSVQGKTVFGVGNVAKKLNKPFIVMAGRIDTDISQLYELGLTSAFSIMNEASSLERALTQGKENLYATSINVARLIKQTNLHD